MATVQSMLDNLEEDHLEHFGKKGMRWGQKKSVTTAGFNKAGAFKSYTNKSGRKVPKGTVRTQKRIDSLKKTASGKAGFKDKYNASRSMSLVGIAKAKGSLSKAAQNSIAGGAAFQKKSNAGKAKVRTAILRGLYSTSVKDLNFK
jgi:hypothetical protein